MYLMNMYQENGIPYLVAEKEMETEIITTPFGVTEMLYKNFKADKLPEEHVWLMCTNTRMEVISVMEISHGTVNCSIIQPREVLIRALLSGATNFIIAHNHPSNSLDESREDLALCQRMKEAGNLIGIPLVDFLIVGNGIYKSFNEEGLL